MGLKDAIVMTIVTTARVVFRLGPQSRRNRLLHNQDIAIVVNDSQPLAHTTPM